VVPGVGPDRGEARRGVPRELRRRGPRAGRRGGEKQDPARPFHWPQSNPVFHGPGMAPRSYRGPPAPLVSFRGMIPVVEVELGALSHPGLTRPNNDDCFLVAGIERGMRPLMTNVPPGTVPDRHEVTGHMLLVADGMGGAAAGEVASRTAISVLIELCLETPDWMMSLDGQHGQEVLAR